MLTSNGVYGMLLITYLLLALWTMAVFHLYQGALDFGYAHEFVDDASSQLPSATPPFAPQGNLFGTYKANVNILGVQVRYNF